MKNNSKKTILNMILCLTCMQVTTAHAAYNRMQEPTLKAKPTFHIFKNPGKIKYDSNPNTNKNKIKYILTSDSDNVQRTPWKKFRKHLHKTHAKKEHILTGHTWKKAHAQKSEQNNP